MKKIIMILAACALLLGLAGCHDFTGYFAGDFKRAIVELPGGEVMSIEVTHWEISENGFYKITAKDGKKYVVSVNRCVLIGGSTGDVTE